MHGDRLHILRLWGAPGLLLAIAMAQVVLARSRDLSPWKGGGFGMFSTVDRPQTRRILAEGVAEDGTESWIDLSPSLAPRDASFLAMRRDGELAALAERLLRGDYLAPEPTGTSPRPGLAPVDASHPLDVGGSRLRSIRLGLWRLRYDRSTARLRRDLLGSAVERSSRR